MNALEGVKDIDTLEATLEEHIDRRTTSPELERKETIRLKQL